jgi:hypothetical protein
MEMVMEMDNVFELGLQQYVRIDTTDSIYICFWQSIYIIFDSSSFFFSFFFKKIKKKNFFFNKELDIPATISTPASPNSPYSSTCTKPHTTP